MSKPKRARYIRANLDFTLVLNEEIDSNTIIGPRELDRIQLAMVAVLSANSLVDGIAPGARLSSSLDARPRDKDDHRLTDGKVASRRRGPR